VEKKYKQVSEKHKWRTSVGEEILLQFVSLVFKDIAQVLCDLPCNT